MINTFRFAHNIIVKSNFSTTIVSIFQFHGGKSMSNLIMIAYVLSRILLFSISRMFSNNQN